MTGNVSICGSHPWCLSSCSEVTRSQANVGTNTLIPTWAWESSAWYECLRFPQGTWFLSWTLTQPSKVRQVVYIVVILESMHAQSRAQRTGCVSLGLEPDPWLLIRSHHCRPGLCNTALLCKAGLPWNTRRLNWLVGFELFLDPVLKSSPSWLGSRHCGILYHFISILFYIFCGIFYM